MLKEFKEFALKGNMIDLSGNQIQHHIRNHAHRNAFGNAVEKGHGRNTDKCRDSLPKIRKVNRSHLIYHIEAHHNQGRSRGKGRNGKENGG